MIKLAIELANNTESRKRSVETFGWWITQFESGGRKAEEAFNTAELTKEKGLVVRNEKIWEWYTEKEYKFGLLRSFSNLRRLRI